MKLVTDYFFAHVAKRPQDPCWMSKGAGGQWQTFSFAQADQMVRRVASALASQGITRGSKVAIWANTCMEWVVIDMACWILGAVTVPIYYSTTPEQAVLILKNSETSMILAEDTERAIKSVAQMGSTVSVLNLRDAVGRWVATPTGQVLTPAALTSHDLASIVYTSGTTGEPKGVELTHGNFSAEVAALASLYPIPTHYISLGFLPLSHIVARAVQCFQLSRGFVMAFAESIEKVAVNLKEVRPHFFVSVPRIFEKIYAKVFAEISAKPKLIQYLVVWGKRTQIKWIKRLLFKKIFDELGGRLEFSISGGAPLNPDVAKFFGAIGLEIYEGYGLTETTAAASVNYPGHNHYGTVGPVLDCVQVRFDTDGEILFKGPTVSRGYYNNTQATRDAFTEDGFFRTGDIGELTPDGYLKITDRKKDLIVTAGGKKIAPQPIEMALLQNSYVSQVFIYGDRRPYITALIVPDRHAVELYAQKMGLKAASWEDMVNSVDVQSLFQKVVDGVNAELAHYETIKHFRLLPVEFSMQGGELTPTLKLKRKVVQENFAAELNSLYA